MYLKKVKLQKSFNSSWFTIYFGQMNPLMGPRLENTTVAWIAYKIVSDVTLLYRIIVKYLPNGLFSNFRGILLKEAIIPQPFKLSECIKI